MEEREPKRSRTSYESDDCEGTQCGKTGDGNQAVEQRVDLSDRAMGELVERLAERLSRKPAEGAQLASGSRSGPERTALGELIEVGCRMTAGVGCS